MSFKPVVVALTILAALLASGCSADDASTSENEAPAGNEASAKYDDDSIEYQLAFIDGAADSPSDIAEIDPYARAIDRVLKACRAPDRTRVGDMAVTAIGMLDEDLPSHDETNLSILNAVAKVKNPSIKPKCTEVFAGIITIMQSG